MFEDTFDMMMGDFGKAPAAEKEVPAQVAQDDMLSMLVGDFNENHDPATGRFSEGSSTGSGKSGSSKSGSKKDSESKPSGSYKSQIFKEATKNAEISRLDRNAYNSAYRVAGKDLHLDDLDEWGGDSYDLFDNDEGSFSINTLRDALKGAYKAGAEYKARSINAKQIDTQARKFAEKALGISLKEKHGDSYDFWQNDRGSFDKFDLQQAFNHAWGQGFSNH